MQSNERLDQIICHSATPKTNKGSSHLNLGLGVLCAAGGVVGYLKAQSVPSLVAGVGVGALYGASAYLINHGAPDTGHALALAGSSLLAGVMGWRFYNTGKFMPAGLLTAAGAVGAWYNLNQYRKWKV